MMPRSRLFLLALLSLWALPAGATLPCERILRDRVPVDISKAPLSRVVEGKSPWIGSEANSDQRQPLYLGATPREMALGHGGLPTRPKIYEPMRALAEAQVARLRKALRLKAGDAVEFEAWPVQDDQGHHTWAFARLRRAGKAWEWLDAAKLDLPELAEDSGQPEPMLPLVKRTWVKKEYHELFTDILKLKDLYTKPLFGDAIWLREGADGGDEVVAAWLPVDRRELVAHELKASGDKGRLVARVIGQPPRLNDKPITFALKSDGKEVVFPGKIEWKPERALRDVSDSLVNATSQVTKWPRDFLESYERDVRVLSGRETAEFPVSGTRMRFKRKNSIDPKNQLDRLVDYLEERYRKLGITTVRDRFFWRGIPQSNLVAVIPGRLKGAANKPILMADHIDTAFSEDAYKRTGKRVSAPGADDNVTATAALLRAAEILKDSRPEHDIWLVHLTGEEFPADDLGARDLIGQLLNEKRDIGGLVLMDMIGYRERPDRVFQINAGESDDSLRLAYVAYDVARSVAGEWNPLFRSRFDARSYLYNTDGIIFSNAGYPVVLLNEHINGIENLNRPHYHATTDDVTRLDFDYAGSIAKVAIETVARMSVLR